MFHYTGLIYLSPLLILDFLLLLYSDAWRSNPVTPIDPGADRKDHLFFIKKGVIEILSLKVELGGLKCTKGKVAMAPASVALYPALWLGLYSRIGVGLLFYPVHRYAKT